MTAEKMEEVTVMLAQVPVPAPPESVQRLQVQVQARPRSASYDVGSARTKSMAASSSSSSSSSSRSRSSSMSLGNDQLQHNADSTRRVLLDLIQTLNEYFNDYDFSGTTQAQFRPQELSKVYSCVNSHFAELAETEDAHILEKIWQPIDETMDLRKCEIYSYVPDGEGW